MFTILKETNTITIYTTEPDDTWRVNYGITHKIYLRHRTGRTIDLFMNICINVFGENYADFSGVDPGSMPDKGADWYTYRQSESESESEYFDTVYITNEQQYIVFLLSAGVFLD